MFGQKYLFILLIAFILVRCSGGGGGSSSGGFSGTGEIIGLFSVKKITIIPHDSSASSNSTSDVVVKGKNGAMSSLAEKSIRTFATDGSQDKYDTARAGVFVDNEWLGPINDTDFIMCFMNATGGFQLVNQTFIALIDLNKCRNEGMGIPDLTHNTVVSTRSDNNSPHNVVAYSLVDEEAKFIIDVSATASPSTANQYGEFTLMWSGNEGNEENNYDNGYLDISLNDANKVDFTLIREFKHSHNDDSNDIHQINGWAVGELNPSGTGGKIRIYKKNSLKNSLKNSDTTVDYKIHFNDRHANVSNGTVAQCYDLNKNEMKLKRVYAYNVYDAENLNLVDLFTGFPFEYTSTDGNPKYGYAGIDQSTDYHYIWTKESGVKPTTITRIFGISKTYDVTWTDGGRPTISDVNFDSVLKFTNQAFTDTDSMNRSDITLYYAGIDTLWNIDTTEDVANDDDIPIYAIPDGTSLTTPPNKTYKTKQSYLSKETVVVDSENCVNLPIGDVDYSEPTLKKTSKKWSDRPTVTGKPKILDGETR